MTNHIVIPVPYPGNVINDSIANTLRSAGFMAGIIYFPSLVSYAKGVGADTKPVEGPRTKLFSTSVEWGVFVDRGASLQLSGNPNAFSDDTWRLYSPTLADFYRERSMSSGGRIVDSNFERIPRLTVRKIDNPTALNFSSDIGGDAAALAAGRMVSPDDQEVPLGILLPYESGPVEHLGSRYICTFPSNYGLMYVNGKVMAFNYEVYTREVPISTVVYTGSAPVGGNKIVPRKDSMSVINEAIMAVTGPFSMDEKVSKIISSLKVV